MGGPIDTVGNLVVLEVGCGVVVVVVVVVVWKYEDDAWTNITFDQTIYSKIRQKNQF